MSAGEGRPQFMVAEEIGERVIEAADQLQFAPDLHASFVFELDDQSYTLTISRHPKEPR
jgi:hypothetical protein